MGGAFTAACVQTTQGREVAPNIEAASALVRDAAKAGAVIREGHTLISHLIAYPE